MMQHRTSHIGVAFSFDPAVGMLEGYSPPDGTAEFCDCINAVSRRDSIAHDLGAGREPWFSEDQRAYHRELSCGCGRVAEYIGADIDREVQGSFTTDRNVAITHDTTDVAQHAKAPQQSWGSVR